MRDDSTEILFQSFLQEALVSSSGMERGVHSLMLSIQQMTLPTTAYEIIILVQNTLVSRDSPKLNKIKIKVTTRNTATLVSSVKKNNNSLLPPLFFAHCTGSPSPRE